MAISLIITTFAADTMKKYIIPHQSFIDIAAEQLLADSRVDVTFSTDVNNQYDERNGVSFDAKEQRAMDKEW